MTRSPDNDSLEQCEPHTCVFGGQIHHLLLLLAAHPGAQGTCSRQNDADK